MLKKHNIYTFFSGKGFQKDNNQQTYIFDRSKLFFILAIHFYRSIMCYLIITMKYLYTLFSGRYVAFFVLSFALLMQTSCKKDEPQAPANTLPTNPELLALIPTDFKVENISLTEKLLSWNFNYTQISGFKIDRKVGSNDWEIAYLTSGKDQYAVIDSTIVPDSSITYQYRVYAWAGNSVSLFADLEASFGIPAPQNFTVQGVNDLIKKLTWKDNSTGDHGFKLDRKEGSGIWEEAYRTFSPYTTTFYDTVADKSSVTIYYRLYTYWNGLNSSKVSQSTAVTLPAPDDVELNMLSYSENELTWRDNSNGEQGFRIHRKVGGQSWELNYAEVGANVEAFIDTDAPCNSTVQYRISAFADGIESSYAVSDQVNSEIPDPYNIEFSMPSDDQVVLTWKEYCDGEEGFRIDKKFSNGSWVTGYGEVGENVKSFTDNGSFQHGETYYYRVYAFYHDCNSDYTETEIPIFICGNILVDERDQKTYTTAQIGNQCWMTQNLNLAIYGSYCYNDNQSNCDTYGRLYPWDKVMNGEDPSNTVPSGVRGICPKGWHVPSDNEWKILEGTVDSQYGVGSWEWDNKEFRGTDAGKNLKSTTHWYANGNGTDDYGFRALPGGYKSRLGPYSDMSKEAVFYTSYGNPYPYYRTMQYSEDRIWRHYSYSASAYSLRCVKDEY